MENPILAKKEVIESINLPKLELKEIESPEYSTDLESKVKFFEEKFNQEMEQYNKWRAGMSLSATEEPTATAKRYLQQISSLKEQIGNANNNNSNSESRESSNEMLSQRLETLYYSFDAFKNLVLERTDMGRTEIIDEEDIQTSNKELVNFRDLTEHNVDFSDQKVQIKTLAVLQSLQKLFSVESSGKNKIENGESVTELLDKYKSIVNSLGELLNGVGKMTGEVEFLNNLADNTRKLLDILENGEIAVKIRKLYRDWSD